MLVNSSSSSNTSLPHSHYSSVLTFLYSCMNSKAGVSNIIAYTITSILLVLPLCIHVIYLGLQRWRHQRSGVTMSHSDVFTYNMVVMELMNIVGSILCYCGILSDLPKMTTLGLILSTMNLSGQQVLHILTCVERYLAVVHPVTYLGLRKAKGIRIRNITIGGVWLLCFSNIGFMFVGDTDSVNNISYFTIAFILIVISFCSLSVLHILIRPGPGEGGGGGKQVDQSKLRAIYTITAILGVLLLRFGGTVVTTAFYESEKRGESEKCLAWLSAVWVSLPSSLVLPLLFLHRAGKLACCRTNNESGQGSD